MFESESPKSLLDNERRVCYRKTETDKEENSENKILALIEKSPTNIRSLNIKS